MIKVLRVIGKWFLRILMGIAGLFILVILVFVLFKGKISEKAINVINAAQPGIVNFKNIHLRPFMAFPDVSLQLSNLTYFEPELQSQLTNADTLLSLDDIFVSLDVLKLIRGQYHVSKVRLGDGQVNFIVRPDSVSNLERALGISFAGDSAVVEDTTENASFLFDLDQLQIRNLTLRYVDQTDSTSVSARINGLESGFSYYPDTVRASVMMHMSLFDAVFGEIHLDKQQSVSVNVTVLFEPENEKLSLDKSALAINETMFEMEGDVSLSDEIIDLKFNARNRGVELLNFIFNGVLDLNAISQIGQGEISMEGNIKGPFSKGQLPVTNIDVHAKEMAFHIYSIDQDISDISFEAFMTNGAEKDMSEAIVEMKDFHVSFSDGFLNTAFKVRNLVTPHVSITMDGLANLEVLNEILKSDSSVKDLKGKMEFKGSIDGEINKGAGVFLDNAGSLELILTDAGAILPDNVIENANGTFFAEGRQLGFRDFSATIDDNSVGINGTVNDILPYFLGFEANPKMLLNIRSPRLDINTILKDTILPVPLNDLAFSVDLAISGENLTNTLQHGALPYMNLKVKDLSVNIPGYTNIYNTGFDLSLTEDVLDLKAFSTNFRESNFGLSAEIINYQALLNKDTTQNLIANIDLSSSYMRLKDLFTINNEFIILPEELEVEEIYNLNFQGELETTIAELLDTNDIPDFSFALNALDLDLKYYDNPFNNVVMDIQKRDTVIKLNYFEGNVGENNFAATATLANTLDTTKLIQGDIYISSDLLDLDDLMDYPLLVSEADTSNIEKDTTKSATANLHSLDLPDLNLSLDMNELRFQGNAIYGLDGQLQLKPYHIIYLDHFALRSKSGGTVVLDGQFNIADSSMYVLSAGIEIDTLDLSDFNVQIAMNDSTYSVEDNFNGIVSADGIAELFIQPDLSVNIDTSSAIFNVRIKNGRVRNFAPLQAISKYTGNADLNNVQFDELRNSFTLSNGKIMIPLMLINSTIGNLWIEGEQVIGGDFLYLGRVPLRLISGTAWNVVSNQQRKAPEENEEVQQVETQKVAVLTIAGVNGEVEVKLGDKRDKYLDYKK